MLFPIEQALSQRVQGVNPPKFAGGKGSSEMLILLARDLDLIEKGELGTLKKDIAEIERMLKTLIKSLENRPLNP